jgi:hypothetical protein
VNKTPLVPRLQNLSSPYFVCILFQYVFNRNATVYCWSFGMFEALTYLGDGDKQSF